MTAFQPLAESVDRAEEADLMVVALVDSRQ
jgi:hypothetical protein